MAVRFTTMKTNPSLSCYLQPVLGHLGQVELGAEPDQVQNILLEAAATKACNAK